jgi:hypothetical protein
MKFTVMSKDSDRAHALEAQLIMCELQGRTIKATLVRSTLRGMRIAEKAQTKSKQKEGVYA